jgi:hypothetical protein
MGVPVGAQTETELCKTAGWPSISTRVAATTKFPVTHGPLPPGGTKPQPAIVQGEAIATAGWPETSTRAEGDAGIACPP